MAVAAHLGVMVCSEVRGKRLRVAIRPCFQPIRKEVAEADKPFANETWGKAAKIKVVNDEQHDSWG